VPSFLYEQQFEDPVIGIDEAGRGPLAGPVVAACVYIPHEFEFLKNVRDSKKMTPLQREAMFTEITRHCAFGIAVATPEEIDQINILQATFLAMERAVDAMHLAFDIKVKTVLVDGNQKPKGLNHFNLHSIVKGDDKSYSIACASVLAKVVRDHNMKSLSSLFPHYGWDKNMGYPTTDHLSALQKHGPCEHHRQSYAPVKKIADALKSARAIVS
jgi:ribonuclease HII